MGSNNLSTLNFREHAQGSLNAPKFAIILAFGLLFALGCTGTGNVAGNQTQNNTNATLSALDTPQAVLLLGSFDKIGNLTDYTVAYTEASGLVSMNYTLYSAAGTQHAIIKSPVYEKDLYYYGPDAYFCIQPSGKNSTCIKVEQNSSYKMEADAVFGRFFGAKYAKDGQSIDKFLISRGALSFAGGVENSTYAGFGCSQITLDIDYKKLSLDDLAYLGFSPENPTLNLYKNFSTVFCISKDGLPVFKNLSYVEVASGAKQSTVSTITSFEKGAGTAINIPSDFAAESDFYVAYKQADALLKSYASCAYVDNQTDRDSCYAASAFDNLDASLCGKIQGAVKHDQCLIALVGTTKNPDICSNVLSLTDDCLATAAQATNNASLCAGIANQTVREACMAIGTGAYIDRNATASTPSKDGSPQCMTDADCKPQGCSGQICAGAKSNIITTCIWMPSFECYKQSFAACGCYQGACAWQNNSGMNACLQNKSMAVNW